MARIRSSQAVTHWVGRNDALILVSKNLSLIGMAFQRVPETFTNWQKRYSDSESRPSCTEAASLSQIIKVSDQTWKATGQVA